VWRRKPEFTLLTVVVLCAFCMAAVTTVNLSTQTYGAISKAQEPHGIVNFNSALQSQALVAATNYYLTSSNLTLPATLVNGITTSTVLTWHTVLTKTAGGTGAFSFIIYAGTHGSTSDTAEVTQALPASTAVIDTMTVDVQVAFTTVGSSGVFFWSIAPSHTAASAAGFGVTSGTVYTGTVSSFNTTTASLIFGLGITEASGGTLPTVTVPTMQARSYNLD
jgi:hypothetical protein